jgi:hypothetical protein
MLFYRAVLPLSRQTLTFVSDLIRVHRRELGSVWRKLNPGQQALSAAADRHAALVLLFSLLSGIGAALLVAAAGRSGYEAALIGIGTTAATIKFFHWLLQ